MCDALCSIIRVELGKNHVRTHTGHTFVWYILNWSIHLALTSISQGKINVLPHYWYLHR